MSPKQASRAERERHACQKLAYRMRDAQEISGLGRSTLYSHIRAGRLESVKVGGARLILDSGLRRLLQMKESA
jgi:predicted DNA-binding transcriptional regulator AlpA